MANLNERVSRLEAKFENMEETLIRLDENQKELQDITLQIKERLDRQNGAIPHLSDDIKGVLATQGKILERISKDTIKSERISMKVRIIWAGVSLVVGVVTTHLIHILMK